MTILGVLGTNEILILFIICGIFLLPFILFLLSQQNTLKAIQFQNRTMPPGEVWLQLIPLFGMVWQFIVVSRIADSIQRELSSETAFSFEQHRQAYAPNPYAPKPTYGIGIAYCVLLCCSIIPYLSILTSIAGLICWIIYWAQLSEYKNKIQLKQHSRNFSQTPPQY
jgi:hypothetical protein